MWNEKRQLRPQKRGATVTRAFSEVAVVCWGCSRSVARRHPLYGIFELLGAGLVGWKMVMPPYYPGNRCFAFARPPAALRSCIEGWSVLEVPATQ